jgi:hypothetical protein
VISPANLPSGLLKTRGQLVMPATRRGFAHYLAACAVWSLPGRQHTQEEMVAWGKRPQTTRAFLYAETATRKMRTLTIDWEGRISNGGTKWIWQAS